MTLLAGGNHFSYTILSEGRAPRTFVYFDPAKTGDEDIAEYAAGLYYWSGGKIVEWPIKLRVRNTESGHFLDFEIHVENNPTFTVEKIECPLI